MGIKEKTFRVEEIHCEACESAIRKALGRVDGVSDAKADATTNKVTVMFDEALVAPETIAQRLAAAGYPVTA